MLPFASAMLQSTALSSSGTGSGFVRLTDTTLSTWTVPANFDPTNNVIEIIAAGANGMLSAATGSPGKGGGGGQYAKTVNLNLVPGSVVNLKIGRGGGSQGTSAAPGAGDTWFNSSTATIYAQAGSVQADGVAGGGTGGGAAAAVGASTVRNGGNGGGVDSTMWGGAGGGGAGGPSGGGGAGANGVGAGTPGGTGGSADGGAVAGGVGVSNGIGNPGATENYWGAGYGPGSGGAGGAGSSGSNFRGGVGANYGGGGGGGGYNQTTRTTGGQGIIVIRWGAYATNINAAPTFASTPTLSSNTGFYAVGDTLAISPALVYGITTSTGYQWYAGGVLISGATNSTYTLTAAELGLPVFCRQTATNAAGTVATDTPSTPPVPNPSYTLDTRIINGGDSRIINGGDSRQTATRIA